MKKTKKTFRIQYDGDGEGGDRQCWMKGYEIAVEKVNGRIRVVVIDGVEIQFDTNIHYVHRIDSEVHAEIIYDSLKK